MLKKHPVKNGDLIFCLKYSNSFKNQIFISDIQAGIKQAEAAIDTGAATGKLEQLIEYTRKNG